MNKKNLMELGAAALADLLLEAVKGDAARQRQVRLALAGDQGPEEAAVDVRKRFASIRRAGSFISWKGQRAFCKELTGLITLIEKTIAPEAPDTAFDLLWSLLLLAPDIHARTDDSNGAIGEVMDCAMQAIERIAPRLSRAPVELADRVFEALADNGYGAFDQVIPALAEALGQQGLDRLKDLAEAVSAMPLTDGELAQYDFVRDPKRQADMARESRNRSAGMILQDVADLQGDVDAWLARYSSEQLTFHTIAPDAAHRLLAAGRADEALSIVANARARDDRKNDWFDSSDLDEAHFACLEALGREEDLRRALWDRFEQRLCPDALRRHLKHLPDFEDIDAEDRAKAIVRDHANRELALAFFLQWPDMAEAGRLVETHADAFDGNAYELLTPAAAALDGKHSLAATLLRRSMILFALEAARSSRYGHAAKHLAACAAADAEIGDYCGHPDHSTFVRALERDHARKTSFWSRIDRPQP
ncbi:DUF6880 family protein [Pseudoruegeria sp. SK021]|uniref:DUF6880 family protein n=1 Tax=Pseudoruegeria sp. SK021 TaxID=1933035 RepID=UPI00352DEF9B